MMKRVNYDSNQTCDHHSEFFVVGIERTSAFIDELKHSKDLSGEFAGPDRTTENAASAITGFQIDGLVERRMVVCVFNVENGTGDKNMACKSNSLGKMDHNSPTRCGDGRNEFI